MLRQQTLQLGYLGQQVRHLVEVRLVAAQLADGALRVRLALPAILQRLRQRKILFLRPNYLQPRLGQFPLQVHQLSGSRTLDGPSAPRAGCVRNDTAAGPTAAAADNGRSTSCGAVRRSVGEVIYNACIFRALVEAASVTALAAISSGFFSSARQTACARQ